MHRLFRILVSNKFIKVGDFYNISIERGSIKLQGVFCSKITRKYMELGAKFHIEANGFVYLKKGSVEIVLTD